MKFNRPFFNQSCFFETFLTYEFEDMYRLHRFKYTKVDFFEAIFNANISFFETILPVIFDKEYFLVYLDVYYVYELGFYVLYDITMDKERSMYIILNSSLEIEPSYDFPFYIEYEFSLNETYVSESYLEDYYGQSVTKTFVLDENETYQTRRVELGRFELFFENVNNDNLSSLKKMDKFINLTDSYRTILSIFYYSELCLIKVFDKVIDIDMEYEPIELDEYYDISKDQELYLEMKYG